MLWKRESPEDEGDGPSITLYSFGSSPNGQKVIILLSLLKLKYTYRKIDIYSNEQKQDWFLKLNPNGRIPVLTDTRQKFGENGESRELITLVETGAILTYLSEEYDKKSRFSYSLKRIYEHSVYPGYTDFYWEQVNWLMFQVSDHSPVQGQLSLFDSLVKHLERQNVKGSELNDLKVATSWYRTEMYRILNVYENRLLENDGWLVGDGLNISDISAYPWIARAKASEIMSFEEFPEIFKWVVRLEMFEGVRKGMTSGI